MTEKWNDREMERKRNGEEKRLIKSVEREREREKIVNINILNDNKRATS